LTDLNKCYLAAFVAQVTVVEYTTILNYMRELENDLDLRAHMLRASRSNKGKDWSENVPSFARRVGWYAIVRTAKPRVVIETGVDKGLGSCILTKALMRNADEGCPGYYYGTDINPNAGHLFSEPFTTFGKILCGDSIESLRTLDAPIDIFINDSDHSSDYEGKEYLTVEDKLSKSAIVLSDNAHATGELLRFAHRTGRQFLFFREEPQGHWYPGAGIGAAFEKRY
jgi:hypothetical protein